MILFSAWKNNCFQGLCEVLEFQMKCLEIREIILWNICLLPQITTYEKSLLDGEIKPCGKPLMETALQVALVRNDQLKQKRKSARYKCNSSSETIFEEQTYIINIMSVALALYSNWNFSKCLPKGKVHNFYLCCIICSVSFLILLGNTRFTHFTEV